MRVDKAGNWAIASRDLFKGLGCEHCVRLSMAVKAEVPSVLAKVKPYVQDLNTKLPIVQGNQRERMVFDQIRSSLPEGSFSELENATVQTTVAEMQKLVPVIAQGYFSMNLDGYEWSGFADLLVLEGFEVEQSQNGLISVVQTGQVPPNPKYMPWDVKNSSSGDPKYQIQLSGYLEALRLLGMASEQAMGIVLAFSKGIVRYEVAESMQLYAGAKSALLAILDQTSPATITEDFIQSWSCIKKSVCTDVYCDYPELCQSTFKAERVLELLPNLHHTHGPKLRAAGFSDFTKLANCEAVPTIDGLKPNYVSKYWLAAKAMQSEFAGQKSLVPKLEGTPKLPPPTSEDLFFDIEWFNPVDSDKEFVFMFGAVAADESFEAFIAEKPDQELGQFDRFLDHAMAKLKANPEMHIYHFHNPEPLKVDKLVKRYGNHRALEAAEIIARMVDLKVVASDSFIPGTGSYSIKKLEKYYDADSKLHRGGLVAGGADAMYQFELFRVALFESGDRDLADQIMKGISDYNKDDCLSTKLLYDWLRSLNFETKDEILILGCL